MTATAAQTNPTRPVLRWHGGKWLLAPWIIQHFPPHRVYVEPFGGAASVLLRKPKAYAEVYNDLDQEVVNLFRVLRSDKAQHLIAMLETTPFARSEFEASYDDTADPVERARRMIVRSFMGFGADGAVGIWKTGFRNTSKKKGSTPAGDWSKYPRALGLIIDRLQGVIIESADASTVMAAHDGPETLHYVDPPYMHESRARVRGYNHELTDDQHAELLSMLQGLQGMVVLSGYPNDLYDSALTDWERIERQAHADGARDRTEVLWINPAAIKNLKHGLFGWPVAPTTPTGGQGDG